VYSIFRHLLGSVIYAPAGPLIFIRHYTASNLALLLFMVAVSLNLTPVICRVTDLNLSFSAVKLCVSEADHDLPVHPTFSISAVGHARLNCISIPRVSMPMKSRVDT
jgi:hypothetical protein